MQKDRIETAWHAGTKPTSWYIDGLDRDGMVKERILLLPSLSTISCQDEKTNREKAASLFKPKTNFSLQIFWALGCNCKTNCWTGQSLSLPVLLMMKVTVTDWRGTVTQRKPNISETALNRRRGEKKLPLTSWKLWSRWAFGMNWLEKKVPYSAQFQIFIFISGCRSSSAQLIITEAPEKRSSKQRFYFSALASC